jgi:ESS family glutamate:Na+ symporter
MHSGNVDSFAFQFAAIGIVYGLTYLLYFGLSQFVADLSSAWGFFFAAALLIAALVKVIMGKLKLMYLIDQGLQRRISGWAVDYLVVATVIPISLIVVWEYIVPLLLFSCLAGAWTFAFCFYFGRRLGCLGFERMVTMYGVNCGTMANGLLLLRIVDPEFRTTVSIECGSYVLMVFPGITACLLVMTNADKWGLGFWTVIGIFVALSGLCLILLKALGMWKKKSEGF